MDDIVQARKARMKLWNTSNEKVCEVHTLDENEAKGSPMRYTNRRYSDFVGPLHTLKSHRRASEMPSLVSPSVPGTSTMATFGRKLKAGIVCTNTDLLGLLSTLTSSATEINEYEEIPTPTTKLITSDSLLAPHGPTTSGGPSASASSSSPSSSAPHAKTPSAGATPKVVPSKSPELKLPRRKGDSRTSRSNSFDGSVLTNAKQLLTAADEKTAILSGWFTKRHQPMATKQQADSSNKSAGASFSKDMLGLFKDKDRKDPQNKNKSECRSESKAGGSSSSSGGGGTGKLKWDHKSPVVDAHMIGHAIEGFLRRSSTASTKETSSSKETSRLKKAEKSGGGGGSNGVGATSLSSWFGKGDEDDSKDTCDSSLCSTLKDLFVK